jgi:hypothetical protein
MLEHFGVVHRRNSWWAPVSLAAVLTHTRDHGERTASSGGYAGTPDEPHQGWFTGRLPGRPVRRCSHRRAGVAHRVMLDRGGPVPW